MVVLDASDMVRKSCSQSLEKLGSKQSASPHYGPKSLGKFVPRPGTNLTSTIIIEVTVFVILSASMPKALEQSL